jgi:hypothetical protein
MGDFDSDIHVWGRPFFITHKNPADVSRAIDQYLALTPEQVDPLAQEMLRLLDPALPGKVTPSDEGTVPSADDIFKNALWKLALLRDACKQAPSRGKVSGPDGGQLDAAKLLQTDLILASFEFAAVFRPGWMDRGTVWPTYLLGQLELPADLFESPRVLFQPLLDAGLDLGSRPATINENYMVGGYVRAANVPALRKIWEQNRDRLVSMKFRGETVDLSTTYQKTMEALLDAESRGFGFAEATEVYSAPMGIMN